MPDDLVLAYMAGIIDADGHISIHRKHHVLKTGEKKTYYRPLIGIAGTCPAPHDLAHSLWGGSRFTYQPKNPRHLLQHQWQCVGIRAKLAIEQLLPFLRIKPEQAKVALQLWEQTEQRGPNDGSAFKDQMTALNNWRRKNVIPKAA